MLAVSIFSLLAGAARAALVCPSFANIPLAQQPIAPDSSCADSVALAGFCMPDQGNEALSCFSELVYLNGSDNPTALFCASFNCLFADDPCECPDRQVCRRTIEASSLALLCIEDASSTAAEPPATPTATTKRANYCDDDDDLSVDCSKPRDKTLTFLIMAFGAIILLILCAACICMPPNRGLRLAE